MTPASFLILMAAVGSAASAQLVLKHGMQLATQTVSRDGGSLVLRAATSPWVLGGLVMFGLSAVAWLTTLARVPLNLAYPFNALGYLVILLSSVLILHERTSMWTWIGSALVVVGLLAVVAGQPG